MHGLKGLLVVLFLFECCFAFTASGSYSSIGENKDNEIEALLDSANMLILNGREHKAISIARSAMLLCSQQKNKKNLSQCNKIIAEAWMNLREMDEAFRFYQLAVKQAQESKDHEQEGMVRLALAFYYHENKIFEKAWEQICIAEQLATKHQLVALEMNVMSQKGIYFRRKGDISKAVHFNEIAYQQCLEIGKPIDQFDYSINLSTAYAFNKEYDKSLKILFKGLEINENKVRSSMNSANALSAIAWVYALKGEEVIAVSYAERAISIAEKVKNEHLMKLVYRTLARIYYRSGNYKKGYESYAAFVKLLESNFEKQRDEDVTELINSYEVQIRETRIKQLIGKRKQEKQLLEAQLKFTKFIILSFIIFLIVGLLAISQYFRRYKERIRNQQKLATKTSKIEKQLEYLDAQEEERSRIALELHDGLGSLLSSIKLRLESTLIQQKNEVLEPILKDLTTACSEVRTISHNLNNFSLSMGDFEVRLHDFITSFQSDHLRVRIDFTASPIVVIPEIVMHHLLRIVQELVGNVVKHSKASELMLGVVIDTETLVILVEDNGVGFDPSKKVGVGMGLKNVEVRLQAINGKMEIFSLSGKSTQLSIQLSTKKYVNV